ncbi:NAC domain-containing protein 83-like [Argentina anserina]|uniref:NAC domain-containing protein 83-like n=1 Tax=Argentina anserina TaxID=57926 RepID=UPI00217682E8|nr:NAC domain-containing protein 83-like [Potentilla anserina]
MEGGYERYMLLPGQRFCPMEDELLMYYLKPKVNAKEVPGGETLICEVDLYGEEEPWSIWERFEAERVNDLRRNKDLYFFTKKKKVSAKGSRRYRKVGSGTWKGQDAARKIYLVDQNQQQTRTLLGFKKTYTYRNPKSVHHGGWIMYEFELNESQFMNKKQVKQNRYVLCLLRKNDVLPEKKRKRLQEEEQEDEDLDDFVGDDQEDNIKPELFNEEPREKRRRLFPSTDIAPEPSPANAVQQGQWFEFDQQYYQLALPPLETDEPAEPQPSSEEYSGQQYQIPSFSAIEIMNHDDNQVQQMRAEEGTMTPAEGDLYGGNSSDVMGGGAYQSFMDGLDQLMNDEQPSTMDEWNVDSYLDFGAYSAY